MGKDPLDVAFDADGNMWVSSYGEHEIHKFDSAGNHKGTQADAGNGISKPWGLDFGPDGNLYIANRCNRKILKMELPGGNITEFASSFLPANPGVFTSSAEDSIQDLE